MQKIKATDNIEFAYHDSGAPAKDDYYTIICFHGHTYHSGTFSRMLEQANSLGYRLILPNRRLYPGSTPYTEEESEALGPNSSTEQNTKAFLKQGEYILLLVYNLIKELGLKKVILVGWSLATAFFCSMIYSITTVPEEVKARVLQAVKSIVLWEPAAVTLGLENPPSGDWIPLFDETIPPEKRGQALMEWLNQYYPHPNLFKKDCYTLIYKLEKPVKPASFSDIPLEEFFAKLDVTAGDRGDNNVADKFFQPALKKIRELALCDPSIREAWGNIPFNVIYGEQSVYTIVWAVWQLEAEARMTGLPLRIKSMPGANHFAMHDLPKLSFDTILSCL
ncbi:hypothetical protein CVT26_012058 [Gymnopilus dilepis]|uniref:AB hydrolase-1 domain-containing protein n=1 Tax=Gymnopilus dilepis TaxID=231916 RepID=A0A409W959_9AGAR|nr:hypothetical protein CVT26_012058 [Gymnopilus dilepis]